MSSNLKAEPATAPRPLPRGRHKLSREEVLASQRERLIAAMLDQVARVGYAATAVRDVVAAARVSRNAFYELFADKEDCFLAASDQVARETLDALYAEAVRETWLDALGHGLSIYLESWQRRPNFARAYLVELPAAGSRAQEQRAGAYARFAEMFEALAARAREEQPELPPLEPLTARFLVPAITEVVAEEVRGGRVATLHLLHAELLHLIVMLLAGERTAPRVAEHS